MKHHYSNKIKANIEVHSIDMERSRPCDLSPVECRYGRIQGQLVRGADGCQVEEYLGIPYAEAPVGRLRFVEPQPLSKLPTDPYLADKYGASCSQNVDTVFGSFQGSVMWNTVNQTSEDCLYLNLWTPHSFQENLPIMVWIYGGGFYNGCSSLPIYNGATLAAIGKVIVVSFNYRTSVFGFLSTGDSKIKGNFGLKDQVMALRWVKENISSFRGDPNNITVFGESAGAASIGYHLISPYFQNAPFQKAIFQSGGPNCRWAYMSMKQAKERSKDFLKAVGYTENNNEDVLKYLQSLDTDLLLNHDTPECTGLGIYPWVPTVDHDFLPDHPKVLLQNGQINVVDCIFGCNQDEGTLPGIYNLDFPRDDSPFILSSSDLIKCEEKYNWDLPRKKVLTFYEGQLDKYPSKMDVNRHIFTSIIGDRDIIWPTTEVGKALLFAGAVTYQYYLTYRAVNEVWPRWTGVIHGADVQWVFGLPMKSPEMYTEQEQQFSRDIISWFTQFATTGDPNKSGHKIPWPKYQESEEYIELKDPGHIVQRSKLKTESCVFWENINQEHFHGY